MGIRQTSPRAEDPLVQGSDLEDLVGYNLKRAYVIVSTDFRNALGEDGFAPRPFSALSLIVQFPGITQSELARKLGIERSGLVAIVDELEGRGYLQRQAVPGDRRVQALAPTEAGQAAYLRAQEVVREHEAKLLAHLTAQERETLLSLLRKIRQVES
ncbi:MarR family winged helix-turn-helix transcriptional regulator [Phaeobacter sp. HF9A]|uniref:MarR family winged helix-turn-helix transcriptional regulator n=1 Tax=Phaeobacter sp. HF9A TaxID=2721561 RepID=UPI0014304670|nr:MarR family transcriptional regulator [Phaeobacter sp. HF9A]NIZ15253.1 MarR family transcriptional regulator [Phaeobacter sp. HF9A]